MAKPVPVVKTVLIVEDERLLARTLKTALTEAGYTTTVSHSAESAERKWSVDAFDLVILDNRLPKQSGVDLLKTARERGVGSKVILVTAFDSKEVQKAARQLGIDAYVRKPYDLDRILTSVSDLIGGPTNGSTTQSTKEGG